MSIGNRRWPKRSGLQSWAALCAEHAVSLKAAALAFAFLAGLRFESRRSASRRPAGRETVALPAEAVPPCPSRCGDAVAAGLLPAGWSRGW